MEVRLRADGLDELRRELREAQRSTPRALVRTNARLAEIIARGARARAEVATGRARSTIRAEATADEARVIGGGPRAPHFGVREFGGTIPRHHSTSRTTVKPYRGPSARSAPWWDDEAGYFLFPSGRASRAQILAGYAEMVEESMRRAFPL